MKTKQIPHFVRNDNKLCKNKREGVAGFARNPFPKNIPPDAVIPNKVRNLALYCL